MFKDEDETTQSSTLRVERLKKRIIRLKYLAHKYKRAEIIQNALLELSNIATQVSSLEEFYVGVHQHLKQLISADNFFIATLDVASGTIAVPFLPMKKMLIPHNFIQRNHSLLYCSRD